jgi:CRP-like cAMP-binding protein
MILSLAIRQMKLPNRIAISKPFAGVDLPIIEELITSKAGFFSFKFGDYLIRQGLPLEYIYFITRGSFKVTKHPKLIEKFIDKEIVITEQYVFSDESACLVGEMSLLDNAGLPKSNIVITSETAEVIAFSRDAVLELAQSNPRMSLNLRLMSMRRKIENYEKLKNAEKSQGHMLSIEDEILKIKYDPLTLSMSDYTEIIDWLPSGIDQNKE